MTHADARKANLASLEGYGLLTAEVLYGYPDFPDVLQTFVWQTYDTHPHFPRLVKFMGFWLQEIEGPVHSLTIAHAKLLTPREVPLIGNKLMLN